MNKSTYKQVKAAKDRANHALDLLAKKYDADQFTIDCTKMAEDDYKIYIEIDSAIEKLKEAMAAYDGR